jgi:hypothetical protein
MNFPMEPRTIIYRTVYGGRTRSLRASDQYNAAANRITKDTGQRWHCSEFTQVNGKSLLLVRRRDRIRRVDVL